MDNKCAPLLSPRTFFRLNFIQEQGDWKTLLQISFYMYIVQYYQRHRIFSRNNCWLMVSSRRSYTCTWTRPEGWWYKHNNCLYSAAWSEVNVRGHVLLASWTRHVLPSSDLYSVQLKRTVSRQWCEVGFDTLELWGGTGWLDQPV